MNERTNSQGLLEDLTSISPQTLVPVERDPSQVIEPPHIINPRAQAKLSFSAKTTPPDLLKVNQNASTRKVCREVYSAHLPSSTEALFPPPQTPPEPFVRFCGDPGFQDV
jgi:hypothetical protein